VIRPVLSAYVRIERNGSLTVVQFFIPAIKKNHGQSIPKIAKGLITAEWFREPWGEEDVRTAHG
jgi:hypothetical protein